MTTPMPEQAEDPRDPGWRRVGQAVKDDRRRRGMERSHLADLVSANGGNVSARTLALVEQGRVGYRGGASTQAAFAVCHALQWPSDHVARLHNGPAPLPTLPTERVPAKAPNPAAQLTGRLQVTRSAQLAALEHRLSQAVESTRTELIRLGVGLTALQGDTYAHHAAAARAARQMVTTWVDRTIAEVEDSDYTTPLTPLHTAPTRKDVPA